jgi:hypothetical protein
VPRESGHAAELRWQPNPETRIAGYHVYRLGDSHWDIIRVSQQVVTEPYFREVIGNRTTRYWVVAVDGLGQLGEPSSPAWYNHRYDGFFEGPWHQ